MGGMLTRIGRYTVVRELGSGGMGEVFLAYSRAGDPVAIKLIRNDRLDPVTRARFEREALIAQTVVGTNRVARFLDADAYADRPWLAMEYVPGRTLLECVDVDGPLPSALVASLGALLAEGLEAVHRAGLLHRDLKPQNIICGEDGPMLIDFGLAALMDSAHGSLSQSGMIIGTVRCMPPEQASGNPRVTSAADVYALGTVLLYAATGHYPYEGTRWEAIIAQVTNPQVGPDLTGLPEELTPVVASMLGHEAAERPTLDEVGEAWAGLLDRRGLSPAEARQALIDHTTGREVSNAAALLEPAPLPTDKHSSQDELSSPLAGPPGFLGQTVITAGEMPLPVQQPETGTDQPSSTEEGAGQPRRRVSASRRIAEELRAVYAPQSAL